MASNTRSHFTEDFWSDLENKIQEVNINSCKNIAALLAATEDKIIRKMDQLMNLVSRCQSRIEAYNGSKRRSITNSLVF